MSPGTQLSTRSCTSSHSMVRGIRPASRWSSDMSSCTLQHTRAAHTPGSTFLSNCSTQHLQPWASFSGHTSLNGYQFCIKPRTPSWNTDIIITVQLRVEIRIITDEHVHVEISTVHEEKGTNIKQWRAQTLPYSWILHWYPNPRTAQEISQTVTRRVVHSLVVEVPALALHLELWDFLEAKSSLTKEAVINSALWSCQQQHELLN